MLLCLLFPARALAGVSELRDITVAPGESSATVTFLVTSRVGTVVVEKKESGVAEIRMRPMKAGRSALASPLLKPGVRRIAAHIERVDVLVTDVTFARQVVSMRVSRRDSSHVAVVVTLGDRLPAVGKSATPVRTNDSSTTAAGRPAATVTDSAGTGSHRRWGLTTIVIDAGHGGKDPGTTGLDDIQEKDVVLAVATQLRKELEREMAGVKIVMTRSDDTFVELAERGKIANARGGRLFISIHCNAMPEKPSPKSGFECYILRPGKSDDAARVAARENDAIHYEAGRANISRDAIETAIMASMAQNAFVRYSEEAANAIRGSLRKSVAIPDRGIHQAGFYVLIGASMPAVLIELGYLTNQNDADILAQPSEQKKIARAIARGIKTYEKGYAESLR
jgi:N-acetylmuramoyl-L-alanine amidase